MTNNYLQSRSADPPKYLKKSFAQVETKHFQMPFCCLDVEEFEKIKHKASAVWREEHENGLKSVTTYSAEYKKKQLDEPTQNLVRPHSPTRRNKPHPSELFLVTRLHKIPRHYNTAKGASILPSRDKWEEVLRLSPGWCKSNPLPQAAVNSNRTREKQQKLTDVIAVCSSFQTLFSNSNTVRVAEAWMKFANEKDRQAVNRMMDCAISASVDITRSNTPRQSYISQALSRFVKCQYITSINHWLQKAKNEETSAVERLLRTLSRINPRNVQGPHFQLANCACLCEMTSKPYIYDYQIHPEWVTQPWHTQYRKIQT